MSRTLAILTGAVTEELGDVQELVGPGVIERALNEGQSKMEPQVVREVASVLTWDAAAAVVTLPTDLYEIVTIQPDEGSLYTRIQSFRLHGGQLYFPRPSQVEAWSGTLFYRAHYPTITNEDDCLLPDSAADGLVSYALYKVWKRIASNRTDYRKYSTLVNNATTVADLLDMANTHLQDWADARDSAELARAPEPFYPTDC